MWKWIGDYYNENPGLPKGGGYFMDRFERTVSIPIKFENGNIICADGNPIPKLSETTYGELIIPSIYLEEKEDIEKYQQQDVKIFFYEQENLYVELNPKYIPQNKKSDNNLISYNGKLYTHIILREDLRIYSRYRKKAKLKPCKCFIPALNTDAESLNHAYTLISENYEINRRSHTGNVFNFCYFKTDGKFVKLDVKRDEFFLEEWEGLGSK